MDSDKKAGGYHFFHIIASCWLVFLISFCVGIYIYAAKIWPYPIVKNIEAFLVGHAGEKTSLVEKVKNDLNLKPSRHIVSFEKNNFNPNKYQKLRGLPLNSRREDPDIYLSDKAPHGYRLIFGGFDFDQGMHGMILINPEGRVIHIWHISQEDVDWGHESDTNVFPHGFEIAPDGSIVVAFDAGTSLTKYDYCSRIVWRIKGNFHHSIAFDGKDAFWTWGHIGIERPEGLGYYLLKIEYETGKVLRQFHLKEVMKANPGIDIFGILQKDTSKESHWLSLVGVSIWHPNDIDPLPKEMEEYYSNFNEGDLLVSLRSPNLIFIVNPDTLKVKWWRQGLTRRQHDPDWNDGGTITIFDNNMHRGYSRILELDPLTYEHKAIVDGKNFDFYTWQRGKHQLLTNGGVLITSSQQGRVFEVDKDGNVTFEFLNTYKDSERIVVSEARFLPVDFFKELPICN